MDIDNIHVHLNQTVSFVTIKCEFVHDEQINFVHFTLETTCLKKQNAQKSP